MPPSYTKLGLSCYLRYFPALTAAFTILDFTRAAVFFFTTPLFTALSSKDCIAAKLSFVGLTFAAFTADLVLARTNLLTALRRLSTRCFLSAFLSIGMARILPHPLSTVHYPRYTTPMFKRLVKNGQHLLERQNSSILSAATVIMGATLLSALLGVVRTRLLISYFFENQVIVDVFWAAFRLPDMVFQIIIVGALSSAFIPIFSAKLKEGSANRIASSMINWVMTAMLILSLAILIWARPLSALIGRGFSEADLTLMADLTRIMAAAQLFFGFSSFLTGIIQSHHRFLIPALSPILYNLGIILGIVFLGPTLGIYGPAFGVVLGALLHLLAQIPLALKLGFRYSLTWERGSGAVSQMSRLMLPRALTLSLIQIEATALVAFSSLLAEGTVTMMAIAQQLSGLPIRLVGIPIGQASLPFFTKQKEERGLQNLAGLVNNTILEMLYLALPASVILLVLRIPFVRLAYGADSFPWAVTVTTGKLVAILAVSVAARSLTHVLVRVFYALHNTKTPLVINLVSTVVNISLSYYLLFVVKSGILGMAAAISIASILETAILTVVLYRLAQFDITELVKPLGKILGLTTVTGLALWAPLRLLDQLIFDTTRTLPLIFLTLTVTLIGVSVYLGLSYLLAVPELAVFARLAGKLGNWHKALKRVDEPLESQESAV